MNYKLFLDKVDISKVHEMSKVREICRLDGFEGGSLGR